MGARPSGWSAPPYTLTDDISGYCYVDAATPAVNYNAQMGINDSPFFGFDQQTFMTIPNQPAGRGFYGLLMGQANAIPMMLSGALGPVAWSLQVDLVLTAFNPATLTYAGIAGLVTLTIENIFYFNIAGFAAVQTLLFNAPCLLAASPVIAPSTVFGLRLKANGPSLPAQGTMGLSGAPGAWPITGGNWKTLQYVP